MPEPKHPNKPFSSKAVNEMPAGTMLTIQKVRPIGSLQVRKQTSGAAMFMWRYSHGTHSERVTIGIYDSAAPPKSLEPSPRGYSLAAAIRKAEELSLQHHRHRDEGGRPALLEAQKKEKSATQAAALEASRCTLQNLLHDYSNYLEKLGRSSHRETRSIFARHVIEPWPKLAVLPAKEISAEQIADMMRKVMTDGKGRTANKLRSYIRAAYQTAKASRTKASIPESFKAYNVVSNPAADTEPDESQNRADKDPLKLEELRAYWRTLQSLSDFKAAVLRFHLLTGGQRIEQLVRMKTTDVHDDRIRLYDGKGRPGKPPRPHDVPLIPAAQEALSICMSRGKEFALSTDGGSTHLAGTSLSAWAVEIATAINGFRTKRIRSGVETALAAAGVSSEIRGRLQSHGISGVQARHYDGHDYLNEKRTALETLFNLLEVQNP